MGNLAANRWTSDRAIDLAFSRCPACGLPFVQMLQRWHYRPRGFGIEPLRRGVAGRPIADVRHVYPADLPSGGFDVLQHAGTLFLGDGGAQRPAEVGGVPRGGIAVSPSISANPIQAGPPRQYDVRDATLGFGQAVGFERLHEPGFADRGP